MKTTFLYVLCEPITGTIRYVGKTGNLAQRLRQHLSTKAKTHLGHWVRKLVTSGQAPALVVLKEVLGDGSEAEKRFIRLAKSLGMALVNSTDGGEGLLNPSNETREKMRARQLGSVHTEEHRYKCGSSNRGKSLTEAHRKAIGNANAGRSPYSKGRKMSPETRKKMSNASKGVPKTPEHCASLKRARLAYLNREREIEWALAPYTLK